MSKRNNNIVLVIDEKRAMLAKAIDASTKTSKEVASILADIDATKAYTDIEGCTSLKAWFDLNHDNIEGIGYKQAKQLIDINNHVWNIPELADIPSGVASALVSACKKDSAKVVALAKKGKITRNTSQKAIRDLLVKEGLRKDSAKVVAEGKNDIVANIAIVEKAISIVIANYEKKNNTDNAKALKIAWDNIKVALDK